MVGSGITGPSQSFQLSISALLVEFVSSASHYLDEKCHASSWLECTAENVLIDFTWQTKIERSPLDITKFAPASLVFPPLEGNCRRVLKCHLVQSPVPPTTFTHDSVNKQTLQTLLILTLLIQRLKYFKQIWMGNLNWIQVSYYAIQNS